MPEPVIFTSGAPRVRPRRKRFCLILLLLLALLLLLWAFVIEPASLWPRHYLLEDISIPEQWDNRTIAFFSDTHLGRSFSPRRLARVAAAINRENPDLILFGGDLIDSRTPQDEAFADEVAAVLQTMQAPLGKFAVAGNHDNRLKQEYLYMDSLLTAGGFTLLANQARVIDGLWLGGLEESYFGSPDLDLAISRVDPPAGDHFWRLLLIHQPDVAAALANERPDSFDLALSGHSHNGQVTFFGRPLVTVYEGRKYPYGRYDLPGAGTLIVSRGLGTVGLPVRFMAGPEVVFIHLKKDPGQPR